MTQFKSDFLNELEARGLLNQCTDIEKLDEKLANEVVVAYTGYDPTADSLHVGHYLTILTLRLFQKCGHKPIFLVGGATGMIGDPSGKDAARNMLTIEQVQDNINGIKKVFEKLVKFGDGPTDAMIVNNYDWFKDVSYLDFLREVGPHYSINRMLTMDSVKSRLERESSLSFLEFNYMLLQGYDFTVLNKKYNCSLQLAGSDQWGNIISGVELARRKDGKELFGLTYPLLLDSNGKKMGKSEGNAVWLNEEKVSPYEFFQYWRNVDDRDVCRFMKIVTDVPLEQIAEYEKLEGAEINEVKKTLAYEATKLLHGQEAADKALQTAIETFENRNKSDNLPTFEIEALADGVSIIEILKTVGFSKSNGEARRSIAGGAIKLDDKKVEDDKTVVKFEGEAIKLSSGKKKHCLIK
ncbi:MAG: tyrosine--tRNA ligase [Alphaproteobacteria bacterium]|jgi:tyrosyl-tRNA synthetase|nr:tyrosine--tRNA ligase [Alphaproteobacteria bacterium]MCV6599380.1 tyrosine--tRNA ligase [Alphaproteobacteria bacterium]